MRATAFLALGSAIATGSAGFAEDLVKSGAQPEIAVRLTPNSAKPPSSLRVDVGLVLIPVTVTDPYGAPYSGLPRESFRLYEDGVEQQLKYFSAEDAPISLGIVFDASRSMSARLDQSRAAVSRVFQTTMMGDEYFVVEFNDAPRILCHFTSDTALIEKSLVGIKPENWTALFDAVYLATQQMKRARNSRRALLILSDGGDNYSRYTESEMRSIVRESDVCIYAIAIVGGGLLRRHVKTLQHLAEDTGGHIYEVEKMADLQEAVAKVNAAIRHQYLLGYASKNADNNGLYRKVQVKLNSGTDQPRLHASWRTGYYAPMGR
jgi:Ca-activated chloride channel homolog